MEAQEHKSLERRNSWARPNILRDCIKLQEGDSGNKEQDWIPPVENMVHLWTEIVFLPSMTECLNPSLSRSDNTRLPGNRAKQVRHVPWKQDMLEEDEHGDAMMRCLYAGCGRAHACRYMTDSWAAGVNELILPCPRHQRSELPEEQEEIPP